MIKSPLSIDKPGQAKVYSEQFFRYLKVGSFLHVMTLFGVILMISSLNISLEYFSEGSELMGGIWAGVCSAAITVPFFAQFDAYGRYQNYKQIKDCLFVMGFDKRLITPFMYSKCQRDAVIVASEDLSCLDEVKSFYYEMGYRRYHILPDAFIKNPLVLFHRLFWKRILFTKHYQLQKFYW